MARRAQTPTDTRTQQQQQQQRKKRARHNAEVVDESSSSQQEQQQVRQPATSSNPMEQLDSEDYFEVLGLSRSATDGDVKKAYRRLAVLWHPDKNRTHPRAEEYFKKIGEAYAVLSDVDQRKVYERYGKAGLGGGDTSPSGEGFYPPDPYGFGFGGFGSGPGGHAGFSSRHARDIFEAFFGGMDPFEELFNGGGGGRRQSRANRNASNEWDPMAGMGMGFGMNMGMGMRGSMMMDSFFGGGGMGMGGMGMGMGGFANFGGSFGAVGGGGSFSSSVSSSSFTDRSGHVVTKKTTTTVDASGRSETVTEEFRNGKLVNSTSSAASRLADAGRMQMQLEGNGNGATKDASASAAPRRMSSSSSRTRF